MEVVHAFSRGVRDINVVHHSVSDFGVIAKISEMISKLENLHNAQNCMLEGLLMNRPLWSK